MSTGDKAYLIFYGIYGLIMVVCWDYVDKQLGAFIILWLGVVLKLAYNWMADELEKMNGDKNEI